MIKSVRPLFSLLLLIAIGTALSCRAAVRRRSFNLSMQEEAPLSVVVESQEAVVFNTTLLKLAAIDLGEEKSREEIHQLLQGDFLNKAPYRTISSWRRYHNRLGNDNVERRARSSFSSSKLPIQLRSPKYNGLWPQFRRSLRNWFRNKRFQPQIMSELIHLIKIPIDQHQGFLPTSPPTKYASCAVVGNSGILLKGEHGALIDSHEMVIRLNNARTRGFEHHVGSKTGMSFVNSNILHLCSHRESCFCHPYGETVPIVMYVCQPVHFMDYALCNASHKAPLLITDARFDVLCTRIVKYYSLKHFLEETGKSPQEWAPAHDGAMFHYSSGMQAVMLALGLCERVSVFGFGKSSMAKHHYHTNQKAELQLHDYEAEYVFYHDLVEKPQVIPFLKDSGLKIPPVLFYH